MLVSSMRLLHGIRLKGLALQKKVLTQLLAVFTMVFLVAPGPAFAASVVLPGYDLFETVPGTAFMGVPFEGVPLGTYDFGSGPLAVGSTDTIVQRLAPATAPTTSIPIELVALQLKSSVPADFGLGLDFYYVTLQSARGGPDSPGSMTIDFGPEGNPHGTFDSFFDVFFDIRLGALDGPIALSESLRISSSDTPWNHPPQGLTIDGINYLLNGQNGDNDFFPAALTPGGEIQPIVERDAAGNA